MPEQRMQQKMPRFHDAQRGPGQITPKIQCIYKNTFGATFSTVFVIVHQEQIAQDLIVRLVSLIIFLAQPPGRHCYHEFWTAILVFQNWLPSPGKKTQKGSAFLFILPLILAI